MSDPVTIGIGMMIAGKVVEKQEWFGEDFGKALMLGGAVVAMNPGGAFSSGAAEVTAAGEVGAASEMGGAVTDVAAVAPEAAIAETALPTVAEGAVIDPAASGLLGATPPPVTPPVTETSMLDSKWAAPGMMVGGQAAAGMMAAKSQEEIEADKIAEEERLRKLKSSWGRTAGGHQVNLNMGTGLTAMSDRFYANKNDPQSKGGLLS